MMEFKDGKWVRTGKDIIIIGYNGSGEIAILADMVEIVNMSDDKFKELIGNLEFIIGKLKKLRGD